MVNEEETLLRDNVTIETLKEVPKLLKAIYNALSQFIWSLTSIFRHLKRRVYFFFYSFLIFFILMIQNFNFSQQLYELVRFQFF